MVRTLIIVQQLMRTIHILLLMLMAQVSWCFRCAGELANNSTNPFVRKMGGYSVIWTNKYAIFVNPSEFWNGIWKEGSNGWRVQLRVYPETNFRFAQGHAYPISTNLMLRVEWGSAVKNSGGGYYMTPNGKFAKFQLLDAKGNIIPPNPNAGTNLLIKLLEGESMRPDDLSEKLTYETHLPTWASPTNGSLTANFPKTISTNVYPRFKYGGYIVGEIGSVTNRPPFYVGLLKLNDIYAVTNEGDYTLVVQPILYKRRVFNSKFLDRVDLPCVTTKVHLVPNNK
jgi:hypothetical protein